MRNLIPRALLAAAAAACWAGLPAVAGAQVFSNAEMERGRQIEAGYPEEREPFLEPRDTRKMSDKNN